MFELLSLEKIEIASLPSISYHTSVERIKNIFCEITIQELNKVQTSFSRRL